MTESFDVAAVRRRVVVAGHVGDVDTARAACSHTDETVRTAGLGALERLGELRSDELIAAFADPAVMVRRRAAELAANHRDIDLLPLLDDDEPTVVEIAAWACGEHESDRDEVVERLIGLAEAEDALVRESAVAALGAIGDERAVAAIITAATADKPAVRRRAVLALAPFEGSAVDDAIAHALADRDWQVRQSAEELAPAATDAPPDAGPLDQPRS